MLNILPVTEIGSSATSGYVEFETYDILTPLLQLLFGETGLITFISLAAIISFFSTVWAVYVVLAYLLSILLMYIYVYASIGIGKISEQEEAIIKSHEAAFAQKKEIQSSSSRIAIMQERVQSENPDDWKLAIIEADIMLDKSLKKLGYAGTSLGERLRGLTTAQLPSLNDAWQAHKVRNFIAHAGDEYILTQREAQETLIRFERVFRDLGVS